MSEDDVEHRGGLLQDEELEDLLEEAVLAGLGGLGGDGVFGGGFQSRRLLIEDSPQRAEWIGDDDYFLRERASHRFDGRKPSQSVPSVETVAVARKRPQRQESWLVDSIMQWRRKADLINFLPDECLLLIFACLPAARDRSACASVCMRWLMLQSHLSWNDFKRLECDSYEQASHGSRSNLVGSFGGAQKVLCVTHEGPEEGSDEIVGDAQGADRPGGWDSTDYDGGTVGGEDGARVERQPQWAIGDLSRNLEGRRATDVRLAAIAVGTGARGGLGKLLIKGPCADRFGRTVTDVGLSAIGLCCSALRSLCLWNCSNIGDDGLVAVGKGCRLLEKIDVMKCAGIGDAGLQAVARGCPFLKSMSINSCENVSDKGLLSVGQGCNQLISFAVTNCSLIGDSGIKAVVKGARKLRKIKLDKVGVTDQGLSSLAKHCDSVTKLICNNLAHVTEEGFTSLGTSSSMPKLKTFMVSSCRGLTDISLTTIGASCSDLKVLKLEDCKRVGDHGLAGFAQLCPSLENLHVISCHAITHVGLRAAVSFRGKQLRNLFVSKCEGVRDCDFSSSFFVVPSEALKYLTLSQCSGIGNRCLELFASSCTSLEHLDLSGLCDISDSGVIAAVSGCEKSLKSLNLSGCCKVSDQAVCVAVERCGAQLENLVLNGCLKVTDESLKVIAQECTRLKDLDVSRCSITDEGVYAVVAARGQGLQSLSLESCRDITDNCLPVIEKDCEFLWGLNLKHCEGLSRVALDSFESRLYRCDLICS